MSSLFAIRVVFAVTSVLAGALTACSSSSSGADASAGAGGSSAGGAGVAGTSSTGPGGAGAGAAGGATGTGGTSATGGSTSGSNVIAMALFHPRDLQIYGTDVYWTTQGAGINKIPLTGGTPKQIITDSAPASLAVDATGIYYVGSAGIMHAGLDGSSPTMLAAIDEFSGKRLGLVGTQLYFAGKASGMLGILTVATSGGTPTAVYPALGVNGLDVADATGGLVWELLDAATTSTVLMHAGLDGSNPTTLASLPITSSQYFKGVSSDGTTIYYGVRDQKVSPAQSHLFSVSAAGGTPTETFGFMGKLTDCVSDANGTYFADDFTATAGVYQAGSDGKSSTLITMATEGNARFLHLDATHLVWMTGDDSGQSRLHVAAR